MTNVKRISLVVLGLVLFGLVAPTASAHVLKYDRDIAAILHIEPDDNPVSGRPVAYKLYFSDDSNRFSLPACFCTARVLAGNRTISTQALAATTQLTSSNQFNFPKPGLYTLVVSGKPIKPGAFQSFTLSYPIEAESSNLSRQSFPPLLWLGLGLLVGLIILGGYANEYNYKQRKSKD